MKKVLFVATVAMHIRAFHIPYLKLLKKNGYETYVAANWNIIKDERLDYCDHFIQLNIKRNPYSSKNINAIKELKKLIEKEKFDIVHCHTPMGSVVARIASIKARKKYGTRVIYTAHGFHFFKGASLKNWILFYPIEKFLARYTDTLITINKEDYELAKNKFSKRCNDIQYVPGVGIDSKKFDIKLLDKEKNDLRKSLGLKKEDYVLTCVARLDKNKNQRFLIECMKELIINDKNIHLLLAGKDELNGKYQELVKKYNLCDNVHFLGNRDDIPQLLKITNIVVSASKREGLGLNLVESIASKVPVLASYNRGHSSIIEEGINGYFYNNKEEFINKTFLILNQDKNKFVNINQTIEKFTLNKTLKYMEKIYLLN